MFLAIVILLSLLVAGVWVIAGLAISFTLRLKGVNVWRLEQMFTEIKRKDEDRMHTKAWRSR